MLHVTNGESVIASFRQVRFPGKYLSWIDVLHDGPVPLTSTIQELSDIRARAIVDFGSGNYEKVRAGFAERDRTLAAFHDQDEVVLWFEHDLFDQLQLLQILDWFSTHDLGKVELSLIQINSYPGVNPFYGLGQLSGRQLAKVFPLRRIVTPAQLAIGHDVWRAFREPSPEALIQLAAAKFPELPYLQAALVRFLEEYPAVHDGLSRLQREILQSVKAGASSRKEIFAATIKLEEVPWGDASVFLRLDWLASGSAPAVRMSAKDKYELTEEGRELLEGNADWARMNGGLDVWLGGVHLKGSKPQWRWDTAVRNLIAA